MAEAREKTRILLIDDSKVMRNAALKVLSKDFEVVTAEDGEGGWRQLKRDETLQVVFTDLDMPELDGYGLLLRIRTSADPGIRDMPVIVVTGAEDDDAAREKAIDMGATDFITKPFVSADLIACAHSNAGYRRNAANVQEKIIIDPLTGVANKTAFIDRLKQDLSFAKRHKQQLAVCRFEIDNFKKFFLKNGRDAADALILHVAKHMQSRIRREDTLGRIGLASFALSSPESTPDGAQQLAERILGELDSSIMRWGKKSVSTTLSAGVLIPDPESQAEDVLATCQRLVESAVAAGGNRVAGHDACVGVVTARAGIDALLLRIQEGGSVQGQLPQALKRLLPLLRQTSPRQRAQLIQFLKKLDHEVSSA